MQLYSHGLRAVLIGALLAGSSSALAQPCYQWGTEFGLPDLDAPAVTSIQFDDGSGPAFFVGGSFVVAGGVTVNNVARFDGNAWSALDGGLSIGGSTGVWTFAIYDDGNGDSLYAGGTFESAGGQSIYSIARWDGSGWQPVGAGFNGTVYDLQVFDDGSGSALYACGRFTALRDGTPLSRIARWDGHHWSDVGGGFSFNVELFGARSMVVHDDGSGPALYVGGDFSQAGGQTAPLVARWNGAWSGFGDGFVNFGDDGVLSLVSLDADGPGGDPGQLFAGGHFDRIGDAPGFANVAIWDGSAWGPAGGGFLREPGSPTVVNTLIAFDDNTGPTVYAGGHFDFSGITTVKNVARWNGSTWESLGTGTNNEVTGLLDLTQNVGEPFLGVSGTFFTAGGIRSPFLAKWTGLEWLARGNPIAGSNGQGGFVGALERLDDGNGEAVYAGGAFQSAGGQPIQNLARWDGASWTGMGDPDNSVDALRSFSDETGSVLYAGGRFSGIGGVTLSMIGKWDGSDWSPLARGLAPRANTFGTVSGIETFDDGSGPAVYAVGAFDQSVGEHHNNAAFLDDNGWFSYPGLQSRVNDAVIFDDGSGPTLYVGGGAGLTGTDPKTALAKWDGSAWVAVGDGILGTVYCLAVHDDGAGPALFVGGAFQKILSDTSIANNVIRWDGSLWSDVRGGMRSNEGGSSVQQLVEFDDGSGSALYAVGGFRQANAFTDAEVLALGVARWDGTSWAPVGSGFFPPSVLSIAVFDDGSGPKLHVGGAFTSIQGGPTANGTARWTGTQWQPLGNGVGGNNFRVFALEPYDDGTGAALYAAGEFSSAGGNPASRIARWNGAAWSAVGTGLSDEQNGAATSLAVFDDGSGPSLFVSGQFATAGGVPCLGTGRWDGQWHSGPGVSGTLSRLRTMDFGGTPTLASLGSFFTIGGFPMKNVARFDGTEWTGLASLMDDVVDVACVYDDGSGPALYVGGTFTSIDGQTLLRIARWDGSQWSEVGGGITEPAELGLALVTSMAVFDDGSGPALYVGGQFTAAGGVTASAIARWDGQSWSAVGGGFTNEGQTPPLVLALAEFDDGGGAALYAAGRFRASGNTACDRIARWDGQSWQPVGGGMDDQINALAAAPVEGGGGALFAGGAFQHAGSTTAGRMARWGPCPGFIVLDQCYPDFVEDGSLDLFDFLGYVNAFNSGDMIADCDQNGVLDLFDFLCFVNAFNAGC